MQQSPNDGEAIKALSQHFYSVVPIQYNTSCVLTARVAVAALQKCGVPARLQVCQLWYTAPGVNYIVGFNAEKRKPGWWDGHVICMTDTWFMDASVCHVRNGTGVEVPDIIGGPTFRARTQVISRWDRNETQRIWWHRPPPGVEPAPPGQPRELVANYANALARHVQEHLEAVA